MRLLIFLIKWGFPLLLATDLISELLENEINTQYFKGIENINSIPFRY